mgnify:FL=1
MAQLQLDRFRQQGFNRSYAQSANPSSHLVMPRCSQCEVLVINGVASHETGCPNAMHACKGCSDLVSMRQTYCADCQ